MHSLLTLHLYLLTYLYVGVRGEECPKVCTCETAALSTLPINNILIKTQRTNHSDEIPLSYQNKNEVLDEADEHEAKHNLGGEKLRAVTCVLQPLSSLDLFLSLSSDTQVLTILQGAGTENITLDESYFQHLQSLVVLEIHGFPHSPGHLRLRNNALKKLSLLQYLNLQYVHLLGDRNFGNKPAPVSKTQFFEYKVGLTAQDMAEDNNIAPEAVQLVPQQWETDIVPYSVYRDQQERAGLSTFANLHSLLFLRAFHCGIKEVNWEMFEGLQQLQYLSLEGNKIPFIHEFSFYGTPNLKHLVLSHNKLLDLRSISLAGLLKLETLDLSYNNISHLTEFSLPPFPSLVTADFHHNPIELILPYTFAVLNNTQQLYLGGKQTRLQIHPNSFIGLIKLHKMSITGVQLEVLEREYLKGMSHLRDIRIEGTIRELSFDAFAEVPKLQELIMKNCSIRKISMDAFFGLYELVYLDLSHNELETLPPSLFDQQKLLKEINLRDNKLTTLPANIFIHTRAKLIRLDKNPWHCTCSMNEWQPSQINKVKERVTDDSLCQTRYDKGSMCQMRFKYQYTYDQSVTPKCSTPSRYSGWSVFHLLRKHLRCDKRIYKHKKPEKKLNDKKVVFEKDRQTRQSNMTSTNNDTKTQQPTLVTIKLTETAHSQAKLEVQSSTPMYVDESQTTEHRLKNEQEPVYDIPDNQHLWTERNKEKYKQLLKKERRILENKNKQTPGNFKLHIDPVTKTKKVVDGQKKWEMKIKKTMENLNEVPKSGPSVV